METEPSPSRVAAKTGAVTFMGIKNAVGEAGPFRMNAELFGWKNLKTNQVSQFEFDKIKTVKWIKLSAKDFGVHFTLNDDRVFQFSGFKDTDYDPFSKHVKNVWSKDVEQTKIASKGWHWGEYSLEPSAFEFEVDGKMALHIPYSSIINVAASKSDLVIDVSRPDIKVSEDTLCEVRFLIPPTAATDPAVACESLKDSLLRKAELGVSNANSVCSFEYKQLSNPPGRFDVQFCLDSVKLQGKSSDFVIPFKNILSQYLLPSSAGPHVFVVFQLDQPLRKGQTKYPAVVIQFDDKEEITINPNVTADALAKLQEKSPQINESMSGVEFEIAARLLRGLIGKQMTLPSDFTGSGGHSCFRCSHKIVAGFFYPLAKSIIFIPKPVVIIRYDEIASVDFGRTQGSQTRMFEFQIVLKSGTEYEFSSVDRQELKPFLELLTKKSIKVRNMASGDENGESGRPGAVTTSVAEDDDEDDEDDEDFEGEEEDDDDDDSADSEHEEEK